MTRPWYPNVLSEAETLERALTRSISRFGDGELRMALGGNCISQVRSEEIRIELCSLLAEKTQSLVCIPNVYECHPHFYEKVWHKYHQPKYTALMKQKGYGSQFITRADSAPWIDEPAFWSKLRSIWVGKDAVLVRGPDLTSLTEDFLYDAASVRTVVCPRRDAYASIGDIEEAIGVPAGPVLICLGATATCLAERLARKSVHALDLGHVGRFMPKPWLPCDEA